MSSQVNFEGNLISISDLPSNAICIAGVWYCDPSKVPKEYRTALLRFPSVQKDMMANKPLSPEVEEAIRLHAENAKKKQNRSQELSQQHTQEVAAPVDTSADVVIEKTEQADLVNLLASKKKKN